MSYILPDMGFQLGRTLFMKVNRLDTPTQSTAAAYKIGRERNPRQRGVSAIADAIDADALGIGDALRNQPLYAVGEIVLHG